MSETLLLISAGRGPAECAWAVAELTRRLEAEAGTVRRVESVPGPRPGTMLSVLLAVTAPDDVIRSWTGTLCWQAPSPYRPSHGRKNWFVTAEVQSPAAAPGVFDERDVDVVACRTGGPGGQHRNKASTAVRATHRPTGAVVVADEERYFTANRRLALQRLRRQIEDGNETARRAAVTARHGTHDRLIRGGPTRIERPRP
ncbi:peptide chain release factor-like protein [Actinoplanes sp. NPDC051494]|uniref:peptide chain release factor-like protein n=1 Tax=Actinoplanes sp. NPDC051494 TaxID=3363907 RepID=UPI00378F70DF